MNKLKRITILMLLQKKVIPNEIEDIYATENKFNWTSRKN